MNRLEKVNEFEKELTHGLVLRSMVQDEFKGYWQQYYQTVFFERARVDTQLLLSESERLRMDELNQRMGSPLCLRLGVFEKHKFIGWHIGDQKSREEFYMRNTGILPEYQGRGIYPEVLRAVLEITSDLGFQLISSKHNATNNRVIIPKLRAGFVISGMEISDRFGTLVRLEYFTNRWRRELMDLRCGQREQISKPLSDLISKT